MWDLLQALVDVLETRLVDAVAEVPSDVSDVDWTAVYDEAVRRGW